VYNSNFALVRDVKQKPREM